MNIKDVWNFLGLTQDRIGRRRFLIAFFSAQWGLPLVAALLVGFFYLVFGESPILFLPALAFLASLIFGFIVYIKICIRRVRDIGIAQGWWALALIPLINFFFFIYLSLEKSGAGQAGSFSLTNLTREQFRRFFSHEFSKPFVIICFGVIVAGAIHAGSVVSNLKQSIDVEIAQREEVLDAQRDTRQKQEANELASSINEYNSINDSIKERLLFQRRIRECLYNKYCASLIGKPAVEESTNLRSERYLSDKVYKELVHIKNTSSFQLFFEKFGFGWWGTIALLAVLFINILISPYKLARVYIPPVFRYGNTKVKSIKTNTQSMTPFQRYSLILLALIVLALVVITIVLIF